MATILVIEDMAPLREDIVDILTFSEYDVVDAENGEEGLEQARQKQPDLILCDMMMPGMNGLEVVRDLRNDPLTAHIPVIFLTARTDQRHEIGLLGSNIGVLIKPFQLPDLLEKVRSFLPGR
jgi:CheY-like chemotaxis protein